MGNKISEKSAIKEGSKSYFWKIYKADQKADCEYKNFTNWEQRLVLTHQCN